MKAEIGDLKTSNFKQENRLQKLEELLVLPSEVSITSETKVAK